MASSPHSRYSFRCISKEIYSLLVLIIAGTAVSTSNSHAKVYLDIKGQNAHQQQEASKEVPSQDNKEEKPSYTTKQPTLTKFTSSLQDTPQTITVIPQKLIEDKHTTSVKDALRGVAGISIAAGEGGFQGDGFSLRGFSGRSDIFLDGMRDFGSYNRDSFNLETIEVLKGPSSLAFGRGSTGGIVNQVSKAPSLNEKFEVNLGLGSNLSKRATADLNHKINETTAVRFNLMGEQGNVAGRDEVENSRYGFKGALSTGLGTKTRFHLDYFHQSEDNIPDYGLPWVGNKVAAVDRNNFYGFSDGDADYLKTDVDIVTGKVEYDINETMTVKNQMRYGHYKRNARITEANILAGTDLTLPLSQMIVSRKMIAADSSETSFSNQTDLTTRFKTGDIKHTLVTGAEYNHETSSPIRRTYTNVPNTSLIDPNPHEPFSGMPTISSDTKTSIDTLSVYALDTIALSKEWDIIGGLRYDSARSDYQQKVGTFHDKTRTDNMLSWKGGVVYKPTKQGSFYASAGTSFNPSTEGLSINAANADLSPEKSRSYELGTKWSLLDNQITATGALFWTEKTNARTPDPLDPTLNVLTGKQRVNGIDISFAGKATPEWDIFGNYVYMNSKVLKSNHPEEKGNPLSNAPRHSFSLWNTYRFENSLTLGAGATGVSKRNARLGPNDKGFMQKLPAYVTFDAMASYPITEKINLQLNVYNIFDNRYADQIHPAHVVPAAGRTAILSTRFEF
jgi:catecholate siderophore receptor